MWTLVKRGMLSITLAAFVTVAVARQQTGWKGRVRLLIGIGKVDFAVAFGSAILVAPGLPWFRQRSTA